ncbi:MAG: HEAT repeat domain-containing protein [Myxococcota bacterium]|jgi:HEAT repeat protein|nr:HEAT repeat domain-containing protein [Myxococcota bacterium]
MPSLLKSLTLLPALLLLPLSVAAQDRTPYLSYSYEKVGIQDQETFALVPRPADAARGLAWADLQKAAFDNLRRAKEPTYGSTSIYVNLDRTVTVNLDESKRPYFPILIGELVYTLTELGATSVSFPLLGGTAYSRELVDVPAYVAITPLWRVLPPQPVPMGLVRMNNGQLTPATEVSGWIEGKDPRVVGFATGFLQSTDDRQVRAGIACLTQLRVPNLQTLLQGLLKHPNADIRLTATGAMTGTRDQAILQSLADGMKDEQDARISALAAEILQSSGDPRYATFGLFHVLQGADLNAATEAARKLGELKDKRAVPELARAARSPHAPLRIAAVEAIGLIGEMNVLKDLLGFSDLSADAKIRAAQLIAALPDPARAGNGQVYLLLNGSGKDSATAATQLGATRSAQVVPWLVQALGHAEAETRRAAAEALGVIGDPRALAPLAEAAGRLPAEREVMSAQVIGIMSAQSLDSILRLAGDGNVNIRTLATEALGHQVRRTPRAANQALPVLAARVADPAPEVRTAALNALGMMEGNQQALPLLLKSTADPATEARAAAAAALASYRSPAGTQELLKLLEDEEDAVRLKAITSCRLRREEAAVLPLINYRTHRNPEIKRAVMQALATINPPSLHNSLREVYSEAVFDTDPEVRLASVQGLKVIQDPRVLDVMSVLLQDGDQRVKVATLRAYGEAGFPQAIQPLLAALQDVKEPEVKIAALDGLLALKAKESIPTLESLKSTEPDRTVEAKFAEVISRLHALR